MASKETDLKKKYEQELQLKLNADRLKVRENRVSGMSSIITNSKE
jgi:hypothetical protein